MAVLTTLQVKSQSNRCNEIEILRPFSKATEKTWSCFALNTEHQYWTVTVQYLCRVKKILTTLFFFISTFLKRFDTRWISVSKTHNIKVFCISNTKIINQLFRFTSSFHMSGFHIRIRRGFFLF